MSVNKHSESNAKFETIQKYLFLLASIIIIFHFIFYNLGLLHSDPESARSMLSTLVQSEAAIFAIVITLSLVAVQFAASTYSARVVDIFKDDPEFNILSLFYIIIMIYSLAVLKLTPNDNIASLEYYLLFSYYLGIFAFIALIPYTQNTLELLKPSVIIKKLAQRITKQNFGEKFQYNPILPVNDMVLSSWKRYDYDTVNQGLDAIGDRANIFLNDVTLTGKEKFELINICCYHFFEMGMLAISKKDDYFVQRIMINLRIIAVDVMEHDILDFKEINSYVLKILYEIGEDAIELELEYSASYAAEYISDIGYAAVDRGLRFIATKSLGNLKMIGIAATDSGLKETAIKSIMYLGRIGKHAAKMRLDEVADMAADIIDKIGKAAEQKVDNELVTATKLELMTM